MGALPIHLFSHFSCIGCIVWLQYTLPQTDGQTDRQYHANSRSYCLYQYDRLKNLPLIIFIRHNIVELESNFLNKINKLTNKEIRRYRIKWSTLHSHGRMFLNRFFGLSSTFWAKSKAASDWRASVWNNNNNPILFSNLLRYKQNTNMFHRTRSLSNDVGRCRNIFFREKMAQPLDQFFF